jgi:hypothetical protein
MNTISQQPQDTNRKTQLSTHETDYNQANSWLKYKEKISEYWTDFVDFSERREHAIVAISTAVVAAFTFALFVATFLLWYAGERHSERQLRAYIAIERTARKGNHDLTPLFDIAFKNCGQTPAYKGRYWIDVQVHELPLKSILIRSEKAESGKFEMPPTNMFTVSGINNPSIASITDQQNREFMEGKLAFYIFGQIDFVDAFDNPRWLKFWKRYDHACMSAGVIHVVETESN